MIKKILSIFKKKEKIVNFESDFKFTFSERAKMEKPQIVTFNFQDEDVDYLSQNGYNIFNGSLGTIIKVNNSEQNKGYCCLPNHKFPKNIEEFDIFIINSCDSESLNFIPEDHEKKQIFGDKNFFLFCGYPKNMIDMKPFCSNFLLSHFQNISKRPSIIIFFSTSLEEIKYEIVNKLQFRVNHIKSEVYNSLSFYPLNHPFSKNKNGNKLKTKIDNRELTNIFNQYLQGSSYHITFSHPTFYDGNKYIKDPNFTPLIFNNDDEIVSFMQINNEQLIFCFPDIKNKKNFTKDLLDEFLPSLLPHIFPENSKHSWKYSEQYFLPNHKSLLNKKKEIIIQYEKDIESIESSIIENTEKYNFLHELLIETDNNLVKAVIKFLNFLEFENVIDMDSLSKAIKEEDIQFNYNNKLYIIEVKGIGGTSSDSDCSQISKIRYRRCEERGDFNVNAIYLVNHQRHIPPHNRNNPPFSENQIRDAVLDKRSLLTTYELYNTFYLIEENILTKAGVRKSFEQKGLISLKENDLIFLGKITEVLKNHKVIILKLNNQKLSKGDYLVLEKDFQYKKAKIISLQFNDKDVENISEGEVGIKIDISVTKNSNCFYKINH